MIVVVGSKNPVKANAAEQAFSYFFQDVKVIGVDASSGVMPQPIGKATLEGAVNRAVEAKKIDGA